MKKLLKKIEEESKKEGKLRSNERYNYFKLSSLFENNKLGNIGKFWMIIYQMNDKNYKSIISIINK